jgi:dihydrodipicolinate synthase/N-acetylneuraminate lyase
MVDIAGVLVPLVTPFTDDSSSMSEVRLARMTRALTAHAIGGFVIASDLGEFATTSLAERKLLLEVVVREAGRPVLVNVTSMGTAASLDLAQHAHRHGAAAVLLAPPYYGRYTEDEIAAHYQTVSQYGHMPVLAVDPTGMLGDAMHERLGAIPGVRWVRNLRESGRADWAIQPRASTDEFAVGDAWCTPLALLRPAEVLRGELEPLRLIQRLMLEGGPLRVAKAALRLADVEVGPSRAPVRGLSESLLGRLRPLVA